MSCCVCSNVLSPSNSFLSYHNISLYTFLVDALWRTCSPYLYIWGSLLKKKSLKGALGITLTTQLFFFPIKYKNTTLRIYKIIKNHQKCILWDLPSKITLDQLQNLMIFLDLTFEFMAFWQYICVYYLPFRGTLVGRTERMPFSLLLLTWPQQKVAAHPSDWGRLELITPKPADVSGKKKA